MTKSVDKLSSTVCYSGHKLNSLLAELYLLYGWAMFCGESPD